MLEIILAFVAGLLTIAAPCILLPLPIILGSSVGQTSRFRPLFITLGFVVTFAALGLTLNILVQSLGLSPETLRHSAAGLLLLFGLCMMWPRGFESLTRYFSGILNKAGEASNRLATGNGSGFLLGVIIGVIWAPCAGPILATILTLIARQADLLRAGILLTVYAVGAGIPMLIIAYGGQALTTKVKIVARYATTLQRIFGFIIVILAVAVYFQYDTVLQAKLLNYFDSRSSVMNKLHEDMKKETMAIPLHNYGQAPEFVGISKWLNSEPLSLSQLQGKVVLVDFWTYSCINCIRTLPHIVEWHEKYKDQGLVIIGVHTPEFAFEKETANVTKALQQFNITYPVAQDNDYATWSAYHNRYWPAKYLVNQEGEIVYTHFGEGNYAETEAVIRQLLGLETMGAPVTSEEKPVAIGSPEMYFGLNRVEYLSEKQTPTNTVSTYTLPPTLARNEFALEGQWELQDDKAVLVGGKGKIQLHFSAGKVFMVADSNDTPVRLKISVDGQPVREITVSASQMYTLFDSEAYTDHTLLIEIEGQGFEAFTFTFG